MSDASTPPQDPPLRSMPPARRIGQALLSDWLFPTLAYAVFFWIAVLPAGLRFTAIPYFYWQLLPAEALAARPWESLLYLHAQPPAYNLLFLLVLRLGAATDLDAQEWATILMALASWLSLVAWFAAARRILRSSRQAGLIVLLLASNPAFAQFEFAFFYPQMVLLELGIFALALIRYARTPSTGRLLAAIACFALIAYTRSLWHPLFGVLVAALAGFAAWRRSGDARRAALHALAGIGLLVLLTAPWAIKNRILFNESGFSSWLAYNLRNPGLGPNALGAFTDTGEYDAEAVHAYYSAAQMERIQRVPALTILRKPSAPAPGGGLALNMNHFAVPALNRIAMGQIMAGYRSHPAEYLHAVVADYFLSALPSYYLSFTYNPVKTTYQLTPNTAYSRWHDRLYYGAWLIPLTRFHFGWADWGFNLYAALWLPLALAAGFARLRSLASPEGLACAMLLAIELWHFLMTLLVDGAEGARMRWEVEPVFLILLFLAWRGIASRLSPPFRKAL